MSVFKSSKLSVVSVCVCVCLCVCVSVFVFYVCVSVCICVCVFVCVCICDARSPGPVLYIPLDWSRGSTEEENDEHICATLKQEDY